MKLKLHEIPEEGKSFTFTRETAELNADLKDLLQDFPYDIQFYIRPLNNKDFELKGQIKAQTKELCSLCGDQFKFKADTALHEILIPSNQEYLKTQSSRSNHVSEMDDDGPGVTEYKNDIFELGEFIHEAIALAIPFNPKPEQNDDGSCKICLKTMNLEGFSYDENMGEQKKNNAFEALKGLKLN